MSTKQTWRRGNRFLTKDQIIAERDGVVEEEVSDEEARAEEAKLKEAKLKEEEEAKVNEKKTNFFDRLINKNK